ncbi:hypothetical protein GS461_01340 [Rhodococcus hoagii]|nr:hypothetical protein [Prescottella equi]
MKASKAQRTTSSRSSRGRARRHRHHLRRRDLAEVLTPDDPDSGGRVTYRTTFNYQRRADICSAGPYVEAFARHGGPPTSRGLRLQLDRHAFDARAMRESGDHSGQVPRLVAKLLGIDHQPGPPALH